ncbi:uncharacterized protein LOC131664097 [Phymastichus coffea]|uniref:uncharacterized protein LOC131664097 n=1 Tax=Phymastichus coffea TaxID=108790 RepID=UPI00273CDC08|nr:uncharacterized protein LOC131664097 [Phymastichus coffea]
MDDYLVSGTSVKEMQERVRYVIRINGEANFQMHGWATNHAEIMKSVSAESKLSREHKAKLYNEEECVLGLYWDIESNTLRFNVGLSKIRHNIATGAIKPTKRSVMSVYDPLGILSPFLVSVKIIMQNIWQSGVGWDAKIRDDEFAAWKIWLRNLQEVKKCAIPRSLYGNARKQDTQLHIFCDTSLQAYASAAYLRFESPDGKACVSLVMAKTRVAPTAVLRTRLATMISSELDITIDKKIYWSDSTTVLQWIRAGPRLKQAYVRNRLSKIAETTQITEWRWIPTRQNPADDATRPSKEALKATDRWFIGPDFLSKHTDDWPKEKALQDADKRKIDKLESQSEFIGTVTTRVIETSGSKQKLGWFGLLELSKRMKAILDEWYNGEQIKKRKTHRARSSSEIRSVSNAEKWTDAANFWYKMIQAACFSEELSAIKQGKELRRGSKLASLRAFLDENSILRAEGRVKQIGDREVTFQPIILDSRHFATRLLIASFHRRFKHDGILYLWASDKAQISREKLHHMQIAPWKTAKSDHGRFADLSRSLRA